MGAEVYEAAEVSKEEELTGELEKKWWDIEVNKNWAMIVSIDEKGKDWLKSLDEWKKLIREYTANTCNSAFSRWNDWITRVFITKRMGGILAVEENAQKELIMKWWKPNYNQDNLFSMTFEMEKYNYDEVTKILDPKLFDITEKLTKDGGIIISWVKKSEKELETGSASE